ncbi:MAG TPA: hypothetical protein PKM88_13625 [bacterium]|nr:hypothetical protein [bacterium]
MTISSATTLALFIYDIGFVVSIAVAGMISLLSMILHRLAVRHAAQAGQGTLS